MKQHTYIISLCLLITLSACGVKALPEPQDEREKFTWTQVKGELISLNISQSQCVQIEAELSGNVSNLTSVLLEIQPVDANSTDSCLSCPFIPLESQRFSGHSIRSSSLSTEVLFTYCPDVPAKVYRARLIGANKQTWLQDISSKVFTIGNVLEKNDNRLPFILE